MKCSRALRALLQCVAPFAIFKPTHNEAVTIVNSPAIILFDGVCNLCNGAVNFIIRRDKHGYFKFASLQSDAAKRAVPGSGLRVPGFDSMILVENGRTHIKSSAALRIARRLGALWPLLGAFIIVPRPLRDAVYDWIARNRYRWFGKRESCMIPNDRIRDRFVV